MATATETMPADRTTLSAGGGVWGLVAKGSLEGQLFEEVGDGHDAPVIVFETVFLVGRVEAVVGEAEAHQDRRDVQVVGEVADHGDGAAAASEYGWLAQHIGEGAGGGLDCWMLRI